MPISYRASYVSYGTPLGYLGKGRTAHRGCGACHCPAGQRLHELTETHLKPVTRAQLQPGDLVFYFSDLHHMSIYVGGNWVVHAPTTGDVVRMTTLDNPYLPIAGFRRPG